MYIMLGEVCLDVGFFFVAKKGENNCCKQAVVIHMKLCCSDVPTLRTHLARREMTLHVKAALADAFSHNRLSCKRAALSALLALHVLHDRGLCYRWIRGPCLQSFCSNAVNSNSRVGARTPRVPTALIGMAFSALSAEEGARTRSPVWKGHADCNH